MLTIKEIHETLQKTSKVKISQADIATALGTTRSNISLRIKNNSEATYQEIKKIEDFFNITFNDPMTQNARYAEKSMEENKQNNIINIDYFPDVYLSAGYGVEVFDEYSEVVGIDEHFLTSEKGMRVNPKNCKMVRVSGNSMYPEYHHGDRVIIDESDTNLTDGQIYAFRYDGQCYVKEINRAGNKIKCISVNKEYEPFFIERDIDFKVFGRILPRIRL